MNYYFTPTKMAIIKKGEDNVLIRMWGKWNLRALLVGMQNAYTLWKRVCKFLKKLKIDPAVTMYPRKLKIYIQTISRRWVRCVVLPNVGGHHLISWRPEEEKDWGSLRKRGSTCPRLHRSTNSSLGLQAAGLPYRFWTHPVFTITCIKSLKSISLLPTLCVYASIYLSSI